MNIDLDTATVTYWIIRIGSAALILIGGLWAAIALSRFVKRKAEQHPRIDATLANFFAVVLRYGLIVLVLVVVLQQFGVQTTSLVAVLGASALAIGLALQGTLTNVASGIMIALIRPYHIGDFVDLNGQTGTVIDLDLFFTKLRSPEDRLILIPNGQAAANPIINHTQNGRRRFILTVGIGYEDDIDKALAVMERIFTSDPRALSDPPPTFRVDSLGDSAVMLQGRAWLMSKDYPLYKADTIKLLKEAFDREGIEIPYPHAVEISKGEVVLRSAPIKPAPEVSARVPVPNKAAAPAKGARGTRDARSR